MTAMTASKIAFRIREHCEEHNKSYVSVVFHGGEPLLGGVSHLREILDAFDRVFEGSAIDIKFGMQSNGLLLTLPFAEFLAERQVSVGISIDGPPHVHDQARVDRRGRPTSARLEKRLEDLAHSEWSSIFSGFLCVVNIDSDPIETLNYLASFSPPKIDFLLPYDNFDRPPLGKELDISNDRYGRWLTTAFSYWFKTLPHLRVREFDSLLRQFLGGTPLVESIGLGVVDIIVVETNGDIEAVDSLKAAFNGATYLGYNIFNDSFSDVSENIAVVSRQSGLTALCSTCQSCEIVQFCGGGYIPNRYSSARGYDNPTIYCSDMKVLIPTMMSAMRTEIARCSANVSH